MSSAFETIDLLALGLVTGGTDPHPQQPPAEPSGQVDRGSGNIGVTVPGRVQIGVQGEYERRRSNYATCSRDYYAHGGRPDGVRGACGLPSGQP